jgi:hypothetical protein
VKLPRKFVAVYSCELCEEELEIWNCYVPYFTTYCDGCESISKFKVNHVVHKSWEWDYIVDES